MAIAQSEIVAVDASNGSILVDGQMNNLFSDVPSGSGTHYGWVEIRNMSATLSLSSARFFFSVDLAGTTMAAAVADSSVARAISYGYSPLPGIPGTFFSPTDFTTGIGLPTLAALQKCLVCVRRDSTGAGTAYPENNRINVQGTSPI